VTRARPAYGLFGLLFASGVSGFGTRMSFLAIPWFVLATTGSATKTGLVALAEMAPYVLAQALAGPVIDRLRRRDVSVLTDLAAAIAMGAVPVLAAAHALPLAALAGLVAVAGAARGTGDSARAVLLPGVGASAQAPLERVTGLYDGVGRLASLVGAPVAGALVAIASPASAIAVDALSFALSAGVVLATVPAAAEPPRPATGKAAGYLDSLRAGLGHLRRDRLLLSLAAMILVTNFVDQAGGAVLVPAWAVRVAHSAVALGLLGGALSLGAVAGNALTTWLGPRLPRRATYITGFLLAGAPRYLALAFASRVSPILLVVALSGFGAGAINPIVGAVMYERVPRDLQARVLGAVQALSWAGIPFAGLVAGLAVAGVGLRATLLGAAALYGLTTLVPLVTPVWRTMDGAVRPVPPGAVGSGPSAT